MSICDCQISRVQLRNVYLELAVVYYEYENSAQPIRIGFLFYRSNCIFTIAPYLCTENV